MSSTAHTDLEEVAGPLTGYRILELGHYVAAPFATRLLADMGADVIKIEDRRGDPVRTWGEQINGRSIWWSVHGRNKRSITLDLKAPDARGILADLVGKCDAVIENFRAGYLARLGFDDSFLQQQNPDLVICHVSGFGQTGPRAQDACFGVIGEALGGLRYLTNQPHGESDLPPVRVGISIGDSVAGLYAALGVCAALASRSETRAHVLDVALTESVLSLMEGTIPEYAKTGKIRQPAGGRIPTTAPSNAFPTADGRWTIIAANSDRLFADLCAVMGQPELAIDPRYADNPSRCANVSALEAEIAAWTCAQAAEALEAVLAQANIPSSGIHDAPGIMADAQFQARNMIFPVQDPQLGEIMHPAPVPLFNGTPREVGWSGPEIGQHNADVYQGLLKMSEARLEELRREKTV